MGKLSGVCWALWTGSVTWGAAGGHMPLACVFARPALASGVNVHFAKLQGGDTLLLARRSGCTSVAWRRMCQFGSDRLQSAVW